MDCRAQTRPATVVRSVENGLQVAALREHAHTEYHFTLPVETSTDLRTAVSRLARALAEREASIVAMDALGLSAGRVRPVLEGTLGPLPCPVTWIEDGCDQPDAVGGLQIWAVSGLPVEPVVVDGTTVGCLFENGAVRYCRLGGLVSPDRAQARPEQARVVLDTMIRGLDAAGMTFGNVVRTWFYNDDILAWYGEFNKVRTGFFTERRVFDGLVPASTGIGARNAAAAALTAGLLAVQPKEDSVHAIPVASPLQCPALSYGSSFSRAVEFVTPGWRRLLVSGTASIAPEGHTVHIGDVAAQTELTLKVVEAILESRGMGWGDATRAIAYVKHGADWAKVVECLKASGVAELPMVMTRGEICRDDLLFELELDAAVAVPA